VWQEKATNKITFYMKGADVVMSTIVQYNDWLEEEVCGGWTNGIISAYVYCVFSSLCIYSIK